MAKSKNLFLSLLMAAFISGACFLSTQGCSSTGSIVDLEAKVCAEDVLCAGKENVIVHTVIEILESGRVLLGLSGLPCMEINTKSDEEKDFFGKAGDIITFKVRQFGENGICSIKAKNNGQAENQDLKGYPNGEGDEIELEAEQIKLE